MSHRVKVELQSHLRVMEIEEPVTFDALRRGVSNSFGTNVASGHVFFYIDRDGDHVRFDTDAELDLALRTSPVPLKIYIQESSSLPSSYSALSSTPGVVLGVGACGVGGDEENGDEDGILVDAFDDKDENPGESDDVISKAEAAAVADPEGSVLYRIASQRLARRNKVHLTPMQVQRVLTLLRLRGRRLVACGLAPQRVLVEPSSVLTDDNSVEDVDVPSSPPSGPHLGESSWGGGPGPMSPIHKVLEANGVDIPEEEVMRLLRALHVSPRRFVKMGLIDRGSLKTMREQKRAMHGPDGVHHGKGRGFGRMGCGRGGRFGRGRGGCFPGMGPPPFPRHGFHGGMGLWGPWGPRKRKAFHGMRMGQYMAQGDSSQIPPPQFFSGLMSDHGPVPGPHSVDMAGQYQPGHHPGHHRGPWHNHGPHRPRHWHARGGHGFSFASSDGEMGRGGGNGGRWGDGCGMKKGRRELVRFVRHTGPAGESDEVRMTPGSSCKKSWLVRNSSDKAWPEECSLVPVSHGCSLLGSTLEIPVVGGIQPGEETEVSVSLTAPLELGRYEGFWRLADEEGRRFGQRLWSKVMVVSKSEDGGSGADGGSMVAGVEKLSLDNRNKDK